jgi:hypothetical protein
MGVVELRKRCSVAARAGIAEPCQGGSCAFWQGANDDRAGGCAIERLELDRGGLDAADFLLGLRGRLELYSLFA